MWEDVFLVVNSDKRPALAFQSKCRDSKIPTLSRTVPCNQLSSPKCSSGHSTLRNTNWISSAWKDSEWELILPAPGFQNTNLTWHGTWKDKYEGTSLPVALLIFWKPITTPSNRLLVVHRCYQNHLRSIFLLSTNSPAPHLASLILKFWGPGITLKLLWWISQVESVSKHHSWLIKPPSLWALVKCPQ